MGQEQLTDEQRRERIAEVKAEIEELRRRMPMCIGAEATQMEFRITMLEDELVELKQGQP
ncbi:MAG: hypothetical protein C4534_07175 [Gaiellales bacterium]|nr:MAG: hypothetical protein C4534_07175 [Gaiellales bacterium]